MITPRSEQGWRYSQRAAHVCHSGTPCLTRTLIFVSFSQEPVSMSKMPTSAISRHVPALQGVPGVDRRLRTWSASTYCFLPVELEQRRHGRPVSRLIQTGEIIQIGFLLSVGRQPHADGSTGVQAHTADPARTGAPWKHGSLRVSTSGPHSLAVSQQEFSPVPARAGNRTIRAGFQTLVSADRRNSMDRSQARSLPKTRLLSCERTDMAFPSPGW